MKISVVVPFHNVEAYIGECLEALAAADYPRDGYEIIFVDNGSTDRSADIVRRHARVRLLSEPTPGAYAARNLGVAASSGEIVAFTDSDCAPRPDWLTRIAEAMQQPEVQLVQGSVRCARESRALALLSDYEAAKAEYVFASGTPEIYYAYTNNMAVRRGVIDRLARSGRGPFPELMRGGDVVFMHDVIAACSCAAIRYRDDIQVRHLEIASPRDWLRKMRIYGASLLRYGRMVQARPLSYRERLRIVRAMARKRRYSVADSALLGALLVAGAAAYEAGRRRPGQPAAPDAARRRS
jgi:glycosyltransferase involved in cell wall biosynthesis